MVADNQVLGMCWAVFDKNLRKTFLVGLSEGGCTCGRGAGCSHQMAVESEFRRWGLPGADDLPDSVSVPQQPETELKKRGRPPKAA